MTSSAGNSGDQNTPPENPGLEQQLDPISEQIRLRQEAQINSLMQGIRDRGLSMVRNADGLLTIEDEEEPREPVQSPQNSGKLKGPAFPPTGQFQPPPEVGGANQFSGFQYDPNAHGWGHLGMPEFHSQVMSNNQAGPSHGLPKYGTPQYGQFLTNQQPAFPPNGASGQYHQGTPQGSNMALTFVNPTGQQVTMPFQPPGPQHPSNFTPQTAAYNASNPVLPSQQPLKAPNVNGAGTSAYPNTSGLPPPSLPTGIPQCNNQSPWSIYQNHPPRIQNQYPTQSNVIYGGPTAGPVMDPHTAWLVEQQRELRAQLAELTGRGGALRPTDPDSIVPLPYKFVMPTLDLFDGTACPKTHVDTFTLAMKAKGCTNQQLADYFSLSLKGSALKWFFRMKPESRATWDQITDAFTEKYKANLEWETNRTDLQTTMQRSNETVGEFYRRWNNKLSEMTVPPTDEEQLEIFQSCLKPHLRTSLSNFPYPDLRSMVSSASKFERDYAERSSAPPSYRYRAPTSNTAPAQAKAKETVNHTGQEYANATSFVPRRNDAPPPSRQVRIEDFGMPIKELFLGLVKEGLIQPLKDYKPKDPDMPLDSTKYCEFHQHVGHVIDKCWLMRKAVKELVSQGKIEVPAKPNTLNNPFPRNNQGVHMITAVGRQIYYEDPIPQERTGAVIVHHLNAKFDDLGAKWQDIIRFTTEAHNKGLPSGDEFITVIQGNPPVDGYAEETFIKVTKRLLTYEECGDIMRNGMKELYPVESKIVEAQSSQILPEVMESFESMTGCLAPLGRRLKEFETRYLAGEVTDDEPLSPFNSKHEKAIYMDFLEKTKKRHARGLPSVLGKISEGEQYELEELLDYQAREVRMRIRAEV